MVSRRFPLEILLNIEMLLSPFTLENSMLGRSPLSESD